MEYLRLKPSTLDMVEGFLINNHSDKEIIIIKESLMESLT